MCIGLSTASAQEVSLSGNAAYTTDYVARGTSQTLGEDAFQFGLDVTIGESVYLGGWTSNVNFGDGTDQEIDFWIGYRKTVGINTYDASLSLFAYTNDPVPYEMWEGKLAITQTIKKLTVTETLAYSPDYFNILDQSVWAELAINYQLTERLGLYASTGYQWIEGGGSYGAIGLGVNFKISNALTAEFRFFDTNDHGQGKAWESRFTAAIKTTF